MSFANKITAAVVAFLLTAGPAFAQAGGSDVPSDAKKAGTVENGPSTTGATSGNSEMKSAPTTSRGDDKQTKTGGNSGGHAGNN